jgi:DNA polymerase I
MSASQKSASTSESIYLVDAHSLIFRVFHAIPSMSSPKGLPTNAVFGFAKDILYLKNDRKPAYLLCAFDLPGPTFRNDLYAEYKAHRPPPPDDLVLQIPLIHRMLKALRVPHVSAASFEADDVLATVAREASQRGMEVFICTSDKDCRQMIDGRVQLFSMKKREAFGRDELMKDWGITPEQVVDFQSLVGDSVDNVPGVPGIGEKTAAQLLQQFGTLENVLASIDKISGKKRQENLRAAGTTIQLTRQLVTLNDHVPVNLDWDNWRVQPPDVDQFHALCRELGFRTLATMVSDQDRGEKVESTAEPKTFVQGELFPFGANAESEPEPAGGTQKGEPNPVRSDNWQAKYHLVNTAEKFDAFEQELKKQKRFAIDLETTSLEPRRAEIVGYAVCWQPGEAYYLAVRAPEGEPTLEPDIVLNRLRPILEDPAVAKINQNMKYDLMVLRQQGVNLAGVAGDSMVGDYLLHAGERSHGMTELSQRYLRHKVIEITELIGKGKKQLRMDQVNTAKVAEYSGEDADVAWRLCELIEPELATNGFADLYKDLEIPLIEVLAELEFNGIRLDIPRLKRLGEEMAGQLAGIEKDIYRLAGHEFNIASPKQLRTVLFDEMKLPTQRKTSTTGEASTDQETLEKLAALGHELPRKIVEHRQIAKLKGTYVDALPEMVNPQTGRVHASFNQTVTSTGRLSSSDPNLQNVPVRREQGKQIRQAFIPEDGWVLLTADYSQIELRLLAHFCGDDNLRKAFADDVDIHSLVASQIFGIAEQDVSSDMRRMAKTVNFGVIYGMSAHGLSQRLEIPREEAAKFIDAYFARYPKVLEYQAKLLEKCRTTGFVTTILGHRRAITGIREDSHYSQRNQPEREAVNMEIQGSAADLMKLAMLHIYRRMRENKLKSRMLLTVHDELVFESPPNELKELATMVEKEMTTAMKFEVPLKVDIAAGANWLDVEEV